MRALVWGYREKPFVTLDEFWGNLVVNVLLHLAKALLDHERRPMPTETVGE
jgi:hypothetical protein